MRQTLMGNAACNWRQPDLPILEIGNAIYSVETSLEIASRALKHLVCRKARCVCLLEPTSMNLDIVYLRYEQLLITSRELGI